MLTADVPQEALVRFALVCNKLGIDQFDLAAVCFSESGFRFSAHNPFGDASGLFQLMPATAKALGWKGTMESLRASWQDQLRLLDKYYTACLNYGGGLGSIGRLYCANFLSARLPYCHEPDDVVCGPGLYQWAYDANRVLDYDNDGKITLGDLEDHVASVIMKSPRFTEVCERLYDAMMEASESDGWVHAP